MANIIPGDLLVVVGPPDGADEIYCTDRETLEAQIKVLVDDHDVPPSNITIWKRTQVEVTAKAFDIKGLDSLDRIEARKYLAVMRGAISKLIRERDEALDQVEHMVNNARRRASKDHEMTRAMLHPRGECTCAGEGKCEWCNTEALKRCPEYQPGEPNGTSLDCDGDKSMIHFCRRCFCFNGINK